MSNSLDEIQCVINKWNNEDFDLYEDQNPELAIHSLIHFLMTTNSGLVYLMKMSSQGDKHGLIYTRSQGRFARTLNSTMSFYVLINIPSHWPISEQW